MPNWNRPDGDVWFEEGERADALYHEAIDREPRWMDADQKLIDATLDERLAQIMAAQRELVSIEPDGHYGYPPDLLCAWEHLNRDIALLQPHSSVPF